MISTVVPVDFLFSYQWAKVNILLFENPESEFRLSKLKYKRKTCSYRLKKYNDFFGGFPREYRLLRRQNNASEQKQQYKKPLSGTKCVNINKGFCVSASKPYCNRLQIQLKPMKTPL